MKDLYVPRFDEDRGFGVEIEVLGVKRPAIVVALRKVGIFSTQVNYGESHANFPFWKVTTDSSLGRGISAEVISPILYGEYGLDKMQSVLLALRAAGCRVNYTCGFHVHWGAQDYTGQNMLSLLRLYTKFERVIDYLVAHHRRGNHNHNCHSMVKDENLAWISEIERSSGGRVAEDVVLEFNVSQPTTYIDRRGEVIRRGSRYHKLNPTAYLSYATVEFRQHHGTLDPLVARQWVIFTQQFVNKAKEVAVAPRPAAKPTFGEMLRVLKLVDHEFIRTQCGDKRMVELAEWLKLRYRGFKEGVIAE